MIQDTTWASEVYASTSTLPSGEKRSNAFHDGLEDDSVPDMQGLQERSVLFAVEPPAETAWAREVSELFWSMNLANRCLDLCGRHESSEFEHERREASLE